MKYVVICSFWLVAALAEGGIPSCAQPCIDEAVQTHTDCQASDLICLCSNWDKVKDESQDCIIRACGKKKAAKEVLPAAERMCEEVGKDNAVLQSHDEPSHHEPSHQEPSHHEPSHHEPSHHEPTHHQPSHHEPTHHQPTHHQPTYHEPPQTANPAPTVVDSFGLIIPPSPTSTPPCTSSYISLTTSCQTTTSCPVSSATVPVGAVTTGAPIYTSASGSTTVYAPPTAVVTAGAVAGFVPAGGLVMMALGALAL